MIYLITGQPGDGKSLYTITAVKARAEKEGRAVYFNGIADLRLPWVELEDATKWNDVPPGSLIVIDECQRVFRPRGTGAAVPPHVAALETHRHKGYDIYLVTQQPMLVDANVRRLVGTHFHVKRKFGAPAATIHEFNAVKEQVDKNREGSIRHEFIYPKSTYGLYKSAEIHTHKVRIPMRVFVLLVIPVLIAACVWGVVHWWRAHLEKPVASGPTVSAAAGGSSASGSVAGDAPGHRADKGPLSVADYVASYQPRVESLAYSAPRYDGLTNAVYVPVPAACIASGTRCSCYSQQATPMAVQDSVCREIVAHGFFVDFEVKVARSDLSMPNNPPVAQLTPDNGGGGTRRGARRSETGEAPEPPTGNTGSIPAGSDASQLPPDAPRRVAPGAAGRRPAAP